MAKRKLKFQKIELEITAAALEISKEANTDRLYERITGIHVMTSDSIGISNSYFNKFEVNGEEILCSGFEAKLLSTGQEVSPNEKFYKLNEPALGSTVSIKYKDFNTVGTTFPYTVSVMLRLENLEPVINQKKKINDGQGSVEDYSG